MGYEINSPIKQVWLPLDQNWLSEVAKEITFANFAQLYKEKYGIDLHDILELITNNGEFGVISKVDLLGAYNVPSNSVSVYKTKFASFNAIRSLEFIQQEQDDRLIMSVGINDLSENFYTGFNIVLPKIGKTINSIDDLKVSLFEI